jgi:hypothetical protein
MSLSWTTGIPIARVDSGKYNKKILHINTDGGAQEIEVTNPFDYLNDKYFRSKCKNMKLLDINRLQTAIMNKRAPEDDRLNEMYQEAMKTLQSLGTKEIRLDSGKFVVLPKTGTDADGTEVTNRIYTAGPTGSGKSTQSSVFIKELRKKKKKMPFYIFSKVSQDSILDALKPIRIKIDEEMIEKPIELEELHNSIVLFDDIDSFTDPQIKKSVARLRDECLSEGRHHNINTICTNHQLCNYQATRTLLLETSIVTFFPSGGSYGATRFLKSYCGLDNEEIKRILALPSRWVSIHKNYPMYCVYESGCFLLGQPKVVSDTKKTKHRRRPQPESDSEESEYEKPKKKPRYVLESDSEFDYEYDSDSDPYDSE